MLGGLLALVAATALAESLRVEAMRLAPDATWRRGDPAREREDAAYLLEWPVAAGNPGMLLQVAVPHQATPLKTDAEAFFANLRKKWIQQYDERAEIGQIELDGRRWLACRRPASAGDASVFQLVTVHQGRAYGLLAFAGPDAAGLPKPVYELLRGAEFGEVARPWSLRRIVAARPEREALEALLQADAERLGRKGMLTGYGVEYTPLPETAGAGAGLRLAWFMEGFEWRGPVGNDARRQLEWRGRLEARAVPGGAERAAFTLRLAAESSAAVETEVGLLDLCAPTAELDAALVRLALGDTGPLERLGRERPAGCPPASAAAPHRLAPPPGRESRETVAFSPDPAPPVAPGLDRVRVAYARPRPAGSEDAPGQALLRGLGLYFVHARD